MHRFWVTWAQNCDKKEEEGRWMYFPEGWAGMSRSSCRKLEFWVSLLRRRAHPPPSADQENPKNKRRRRQDMGAEEEEECCKLFLSLSLSPLLHYFLPLPHLSEGAMLTFGPWGALSCPPATQWTLKHLAAEGNSQSSIFHEHFCRNFSHLFCTHICYF